MVDVGWVRKEFADFAHLVARQHVPPPPGVVSGGSYRFVNGSAAEREAQAEVVEQVLDACYPQWRSIPPARGDDWARHKTAMPRCMTALERQEEIQTALGPTGPRLAAGELHPWIWTAARFLWEDGHYRKAVEAAGQAVNTQAQAKVGTNDLSEVTLFQHAFSDTDAPSDMARLRLPEDDNGKTAQSVRRGIRDFASGCYSGIRNPLTHGDPGQEIDPDEALEMLAAFSILARWTDRAVVRT